MAGPSIMSTTPGGMFPMNILVRALGVTNISAFPPGVVHGRAWSWASAAGRATTA